MRKKSLFQLWQKKPAAPGGKTYYYYRGAEEKTWHSTGLTDRHLAERYAALHVGHTGVDTTLADYAQDFFVWDRCSWIKLQHERGKRFSESVAKSRRNHLDKYIFPRWGKNRLTEIRWGDVENWLLGLSLSNQSKNHILYSFRIVLRKAAKDLGLLNPLADVEPFGVTPKQKDIFSHAELQKLFDPDHPQIWFSPMYRSAFMLLASTGIRCGEMRALQWKHNFEPGALVVEQSIKDNGEVGATESGRSRVLLAPKKVQISLDTWRAKTPYPNADCFIFSAADGQPMGRRTISNRFDKALELAGIAKGKRNLTPHSFRHGFNTAMKNVLPGDTLRLMMGHRSERMTETCSRFDATSGLKRLEEARDIVEAIL